LARVVPRGGGSLSRILLIPKSPRILSDVAPSTIKTTTFGEFVSAIRTGFA